MSEHTCDCSQCNEIPEQEPLKIAREVHQWISRHFQMHWSHSGEVRVEAYIAERIGEAVRKEREYQDRLLETLNAVAVAAGLPDALADNAPVAAPPEWNGLLSEKVRNLRERGESSDAKADKWRKDAMDGHRAFEAIFGEQVNGRDWPMKMEIAKRELAELSAKVARHCAGIAEGVAEAEFVENAGYSAGLAIKAEIELVFGLKS